MSTTIAYHFATFGRKITALEAMELLTKRAVELETVGKPKAGWMPSLNWCLGALVKSADVEAAIENEDEEDDYSGKYGPNSGDFRRTFAAHVETVFGEDPALAITEAVPELT